MTKFRNDPLAVAARLAPVPATRKEATTDAWVRHYAALSLAAFTVLDREGGNLQPHPAEGSRPDLGYLVGLGVAAMAAAFALHAGRAPQSLWDHTPEAGALNGEWEEWVTGVLDELGVNPADINPEYNSGDFRSSVRAVAA